MIGQFLSLTTNLLSDVIWLVTLAVGVTMSLVWRRSRLGRRPRSAWAL